MSDIYLTSFCNKPHCLKTGKPVDHQCYILPVQALKLEKYDDIDGAYDILASTKLEPHNGI